MSKESEKSLGIMSMDTLDEVQVDWTVFKESLDSLDTVHGQSLLFHSNTPARPSPGSECPWCPWMMSRDSMDILQTGTESRQEQSDQGLTMISTILSKSLRAQNNEPEDK